MRNFSFLKILALFKIFLTLKTIDDRFIVKSLLASEIKQMSEFLESYFTYMHAVLVEKRPSSMGQVFIYIV